APSSPKSVGFLIEENRTYTHPKGLIRITKIGVWFSGTDIKSDPNIKIVRVYPSIIEKSGNKAIDDAYRKFIGGPLEIEMVCPLASIPPREWAHLNSKDCYYSHALLSQEHVIPLGDPWLPVKVSHSYGLVYGEWLH